MTHALMDEKVKEMHGVTPGVLIRVSVGIEREKRGREGERGQRETKREILFPLSPFGFFLLFSPSFSLLSFSFFSLFSTLLNLLSRTQVY